MAANNKKKTKDRAARDVAAAVAAFSAIVEHDYLSELKDELFEMASQIESDAFYAARAACWDAWGDDESEGLSDQALAGAAPDTCWRLHDLANDLREQAETIIGAAAKFDKAAASAWENFQDHHRDDTHRATAA